MTYKMALKFFKLILQEFIFKYMYSYLSNLQNEQRFSSINVHPRLEDINHAYLDFIGTFINYLNPKIISQSFILNIQEVRLSNWTGLPMIFSWHIPNGSKCFDVFQIQGSADKVRQVNKTTISMAGRRHSNPFYPRKSR